MVKACHKALTFVRILTFTKKTENINFATEIVIEIKKQRNIMIIEIEVKFN